MHFLRFAASQPEPAVVLGDDDIFVAPRALLTYAWALIRASKDNGATGPGGGDWYAGRFDWYSWRTETLQATAYWRALRGAQFGAYQPFRNCSPNGNGWVASQAADGKTVTVQAAAPAPGQERCVGPFAFGKGPLAMLSAPVVRWLVASDQFRRDTTLAASFANGTKPRGRTVDRVPQDVQMGYWLSTHPSLRYVHLPKKTGWADAFVEVCDLRRLLIAHRVPWDQFAWLSQQTHTMWKQAPHVGLLLKCGGPPCPPGECAHAPQQVACAIELRLPRPESYDVQHQSFARAGCSECECWRGEGERRISSGGRCNFTRTYEPQLPEHCWHRGPRHKGKLPPPIAIAKGAVVGVEDHLGGAQAKHRRRPESVGTA